jgi:hypothetical protein
MFQRRMVDARVLVGRLSLVLLVALAFGFAQNTQARPLDKKPNYGRIEISTNPGGFPMLVDGQPTGDTTLAARQLDLTPGPHTVEITFPNGARWVRQFNIVAGRKNCIALNYRPRTVTIEKSPCPYQVNVSAPATVAEGDQITFTADASYAGTSALNYTWTVSPPSATITSGAGTPSITVDSTGLGNQSVTAILVVDDGSGERACRQTAQASTNIQKPPPVECRPFDEFSSVAFDDDKARLDNLAIGLQNEPASQAYVIVYAGRRSRAGQAERLGQRSIDYLTAQRGLDARRVTIINGGYRETDYFEIWVCPQGATPPQPRPTVSASEVQPGTGTAAPSRRGRRGRRR